MVSLFELEKYSSSSTTTTSTAKHRATTRTHIHTYIDVEMGRHPQHYRVPSTCGCRNYSSNSFLFIYVFFFDIFFLFFIIMSSPITAHTLAVSAIKDEDEDEEEEAAAWRRSIAVKIFASPSCWYTSFQRQRPDPSVFHSQRTGETDISPGGCPPACARCISISQVGSKSTDDYDYDYESTLFRHVYLLFLSSTCFFISYHHQYYIPTSPFPLATFSFFIFYYFFSLNPANPNDEATASRQADKHIFPFLPRHKKKCLYQYDDLFDFSSKLWNSASVKIARILKRVVDRSSKHVGAISTSSWCFYFFFYFYFWFYLLLPLLRFLSFSLYNYFYSSSGVLVKRVKIPSSLISLVRVSLDHFQTTFIPIFFPLYTFITYLIDTTRFSMSNTTNNIFFLYFLIQLLFL